MSGFQTIFQTVGSTVCSSLLLVASMSMAPAPAEAAAPDASAAPSATDATLVAQADIPLFERSGYVGSCRSSGATAISVYTSTAQTAVVRQLQPYTRLTLTGVLGEGLAQISAPAVGWVRSATLLTNCDAGPGPGPEPVGACYEVVPAELAVRSAPYGTAVAAVVRGNRVYAASPPQRQTTSDGRVWLNATYRQNPASTGWIAETGTGGVGRNLVACP